MTDITKMIHVIIRTVASRLPRNICKLFLMCVLFVLAMIGLSCILSDVYGTAIKQENHTRIGSSFPQNSISITTEMNTSSSPTTRVIILTYMRSGSTFVGSLLEHNPEVAYWFEPVLGLYSALYYSTEEIYPIDISHFKHGKRRIPKMEHEFLRDNLLALLECNYENVAVDTMFEIRGLYDFDGLQEPHYKSCWKNAMRKQNITARPSPVQKALRWCHEKVHTGCTADEFPVCHKIIQAVHDKDDEALQQLQKVTPTRYVKNFEKRHTCISNLKTVFHTCVNHVTSMCTAKPIRAAKVIRLSMETIATILEKDPQVKVLHLLRDPRGIISSRIKTQLLSREKGHNTRTKVLAEAEFLCEKIINDIKVRKELEQKFHTNFMEVRYENVATDPHSNYHEIYDFLKIKKQERVENWITRSTHADPHKRGTKAVYGTLRRNSTKTAFMWQEKLDPEVINNINSLCDELIVYLNS